MTHPFMDYIGRMLSEHYNPTDFDFSPLDEAFNSFIDYFSTLDGWDKHAYTTRQWEDVPQEKGRKLCDISYMYGYNRKFIMRVSSYVSDDRRHRYNLSLSRHGEGKGMLLICQPEFPEDFGILYAALDAMANNKPETSENEIVMTCPNCGTERKPHCICFNCHECKYIFGTDVHGNVLEVSTDE